MSQVNWLGLRTGFPFIIQDAGTTTVGSGTYYPVGLTWTEFMRFWWRLKKVTFNGSTDLTVTGPPPRTFSGTLADDPTDDAVINTSPAGAATRESQLILGDSQARTALAGTMDEGDGVTHGFPGFYNVGPNIAAGMLLAFIKKDGLIYPPMFLAMSSNLNDTGTIGTGAGTGTCTVLGKTFTLYDSYSAGTASDSMTVDHEEDWVYDGLYDIATGDYLG